MPATAQPMGDFGAAAAAFAPFAAFAALRAAPASTAFRAMRLFEARRTVAFSGPGLRPRLDWALGLRLSALG